MITFNKLLDDESGTTAIEYGLLAGLVGVAIIGALVLLGGSLDGLFTTVADDINDAANP